LSEQQNWLPPTAYPPPPEPPKPPKRVPLWAPFAALLAAVFVISLIGAVAFALVHASDPSVHADDPPVGLTLILTGVQDAAFVFAAWITVYLVFGRVSRADFGLERVKRFWPAVGWMALVMVAFWVATAILSAIDKPDDQQLVTDVKAEDSFAVLGGYFLLICLIAPFVEELFFRGFIYTVLWKRLGPVVGAVITGVVFGLGHAPAPWVSLAALGVFGFGLCLLYWRTQSIVPGMALHALNNSITFGAIKDLDPAAFAGVVCLSVGAVTAVGAAVSARRTQVAR
jgi:membrane protease YdiL (CAAX protease family)